MRILRVHNRYQERGGEDVSFDTEVKLLRDHGHAVESVEFSNDGINGGTPAASLRLGVTAIWSTEGRRRIDRVLRDFSPDIAHFDNTFPLVSPGVYSICRDHGVPVVQSLRNYRLLCPNALFFRDGRPCEDCLGKTPPLPGIIHACYRGSRTQTASVAAMLTFHRARGTWKREVDRYVTLSHFARQKLVEGGLPSDKISVKPNFLDVSDRPRSTDRHGFLFVGRLSKEKGVGTVLTAWRGLSGQRLTWVGDGPLRDEVDKSASVNPEMHVFGRKTARETYEEMQSAEALIFPSELYETFGRVAIEAFAQGTPVIASRIGAIAELIDNGRTGLLFNPGDQEDLVAKVKWASEHPSEVRQMGENARSEYEAKYTPNRNYEMIMKIYKQTIQEASQRQSTKSQR